MILCTSCKHYTTNMISHTYECKHEKSVYYISPVNGAKLFNKCREMREGTICGADAKLFEPKEAEVIQKKPWWKIF